MATLSLGGKASVAQHSEAPWLLVLGKSAHQLQMRRTKTLVSFVSADSEPILGLRESFLFCPSYLVSSFYCAGSLEIGSLVALFGNVLTVLDEMKERRCGGRSFDLTPTRATISAAYLTWKS